MISMKENHNQCQFSPFTILADTTSSISSEIPQDCPQDQAPIHGDYHHLIPPQMQQQEPSSDPLSIGGSSGNGHAGEGHAQGSSKWMSSKMRLMRKMLHSDQILAHKQRRTQSFQDQVQLNQESINNSPSDIIRVCSNCKTTKTPLWRSGPQGPKSLCNACGIRQMKARRAMRAAAAAEETRSNVDRTIPFKKRFKIVTSASSATKKLQFDDMEAVNLSSKLPFQQTFPQEEKDAAILLMALSCGLIHG